jgi:hypothetical protein
MHVSGGGDGGARGAPTTPHEACRCRPRSLLCCKQRVALLDHAVGAAAGMWPPGAAAMHVCTSACALRPAAFSLVLAAAALQLQPDLGCVQGQRESLQVCVRSTAHQVRPPAAHTIAHRLPGFRV